MLLLNDGTQVDKQIIEDAYNAGTARLVHSHRHAPTALGDSIATSLAVDGQDIDMRGQCYSVWDEVWTTVPESLEACLAAAVTV